MNVKMLKELLQNFNDNDLIVLSKDEEGNGFSPLADAEEVIYVPNSTWSGDIYYKKLTPELEKEGYSEEDVYFGDDAIEAVVLYPIN